MKEIINIEKAAENLNQINWKKAGDEIWSDIGWHNKDSKINSDNWLKHCGGALNDYSFEIGAVLERLLGQKLRPLEISRVCTYLKIVKAVGINYHHPSFDLLK